MRAPHRRPTPLTADQMERRLMALEADMTELLRQAIGDLAEMAALAREMRTLSVTPADHRAITLKQAAADFGLHEETLRKLTTSGRLPALRFGRSVRVQIADLVRLGRQLPLEDPA